MPDRHGTELTPGDPVLLYDEDDDAASATILGVLADGRYLIQLDPPEPRKPLPKMGPMTVTELTMLAQAIAATDQAMALIEEGKRLGIDSQNPFEVSGDRLEYFGEWGDEDE